MKEMLVVVDYQKDFVDGSLGFPGAEKLDEGIASEVLNAKASGDIIVVTRDTHGGDYLQTREGRNLPIPHTIIGTEGWEVYGKTKEALDDVKDVIYIDKGSFGMHPTEAVKLPMGVEKVRIVGLVSNICVLSQAVMLQALYPEATVEVVEYLTGSSDNGLHEAAMKVLEGIQVKVIKQ